MPDEPPRWLGFAIANSLFVVLVALSIALGIAVVYGLGPVGALGLVSLSGFAV